MAGRDGALATLERQHSALYLVASAAMVIFVTNTALRTYQGTSFAPVQQFIAPAGFMIGLLGLMGLYRSLSARARRLAQAALTIAALSALNWAVIVVAGVLETGGVIAESPTLQAITGVVALLTMVLAYGLFGVASTLTGEYRRIVGGLLLLEAVTFVGMLVNAAASLGAPLIVFEVSHLVVYLGLGISLRRDTDPTARAEPATDATA